MQNKNEKTTTKKIKQIQQKKIKQKNIKGKKYKK